MVDCGVSSCGPGQKTTCCCSQNGTSLFCERSTAVHAPPEHDEPDKQPKLKCGGLCTVAPERSNTWFKLVQKASRTKPWFSYGTAVGALPPARLGQYPRRYTFSNCLREICALAGSWGWALTSEFLLNSKASESRHIPKAVRAS